MTEHAIQAAFVARAKRAGLLVFSVPNERRGRRELGALQARGLLTGAPDLIIVGDGWNAAIEVKTTSGKLRPQQAATLWRFAARGWYARVLRGYAEIDEIATDLGF